MKRTLKSLLAVAGLAFIGLGSLVLPSQAQAAITCTGIDNSQPATNWPYNTNVVGCTNTTASGQTALINAYKALQAQTPDLWAKFQTTKPQVYLFKNVADYDSYFNAHPTLPHPAAGSGPGFTYSPGSPAVPQFTVLFEDRNNSGAIDRLTKNVGVHELGHWADYIYRGLNAQISRMSEGLVFQDQVYYDFLDFNEKVTCQTSTGGPGLFTGFGPVAPVGTFFCGPPNGTGADLAAAFAGLTNKGVVFQAYQQLFDPAKEVWSELLAVQTGNRDTAATVIDSIDQNYNAPNIFACSKVVVQKATVNGVLASSSDLEAAACYTRPTVPGSVACTLVEQGTTYGYPYKARFGQYVYCGTTPATYKFPAGDLLQNLPGDDFGK